MSLKTIPGLGKSGMSRMWARRSVTAPGILRPARRHPDRQPPGVGVCPSRVTCGAIGLPVDVRPQDLDRPGGRGALDVEQAPALLRLRRLLPRETEMRDAQ